MKVSGFTIVRNAVRFDYPVVEAIESVLPLCDEFVVNVGQSEDDTLELIQNIQSPKIKVVESTWDDTIRIGGKVLAIETDKAFRAISPEADWAFYIQADEVLHEKYHDAVYHSMQRWLDDTRVEGLLFEYLHFYGSYNYVGNSRRWYRREVRIVRNDPGIHSFRDAQGFRKNGKRLWVRHSGAVMYHYGWVRPPKVQNERRRYFHRWWHPDDWIEKHILPHDSLIYENSGSLLPFTESHPAVMKKRIRSMSWSFNYQPAKEKKLSGLDRLLEYIESKTGVRLFEYRNYRLL